MRFDLHAGVENALRKHARRALPREACGLLACSSEGVQRYLSMTNMTNTATGRTRFAMDPVEFCRRERQLREAGFRICAFFHSHPGGRATPSPADVVAVWPGYVQLILGMLDGVLTAWRLDPGHDGRLRQIPISAT